jgi:hypothetical protein
MLSLMSSCVRKGWVQNWNFVSTIIQPCMTAVSFLGSAHRGIYMRLEGQDQQRKSQENVV